MILGGQIILHPDDVPVSGGGATQHAVIPPKIRSFGKMIDLQSLLPGDLVLVSQVKFSFRQPMSWFIERMIRNTQMNGGYSQADGQWTHAAVHLLDGHICEATRDGVRQDSIWKYCTGNHQIRIRRNRSLTNDQRWKLALYAASQSGLQYGFGSVLSLYAQSFHGFDRQVGKSAIIKRSLYCSELYSMSHWKATAGSKIRDIGNPSAEDYTPASLSACKVMTDVQISWRAIDSLGL